MEANIQKVLSMKEPPYITKKRVMNELDLTSSQAYVLLKEMTDKNLIKKFGRGDDAIYKAVNVNINEQIYA
jgi:predicted HTH transcriptional regulator